MKVYMRCSRDKYELPLAVADTPAELALLTGKTKGSVLSLISKKSRGWYKIEIEDEGMHMTDNEIVKSYKQSKNKQHQIKILAELNDTSPEEIKKVLKSKGVDLRGGNFRAKAAIINQDFEDAVNEMIKQSDNQTSEQLPEIEAADPVPGEIGYKVPDPEVKPPLGLTPRDIAETLFNESRIREIIAAMNRYYDSNMDIPEEWRSELKERL